MNSGCNMKPITVSFAEDSDDQKFSNQKGRVNYRVYNMKV